MRSVVSIVELLDCESVVVESIVLDRGIVFRGVRLGCGVRGGAGLCDRLDGDNDEDLIAILVEERGFMGDLALLFEAFYYTVRRSR